jgi:hypothetical protein
MKAIILKIDNNQMKELSLNELIKIEGGTDLHLPDPPFKIPGWWLRKIPFCVPPFTPKVYTPVMRRI